MKTKELLLAGAICAVILVSAYTMSACKEPVQIEEPTETTTVEEVETEPATEPPYTEHELELLAHAIGGEAGATYCSDTMRYYVGSVVLNRVASAYFPDTLEAVIFQEGQYACTWCGMFEWEPSERCYEIAKDLLEHGSVLPENVIFQAEFEQGDGVYCQEQNMIFCYKN